MKLFFSVLLLYTKPSIYGIKKVRQHGHNIIHMKLADDFTLKLQKFALTTSIQFHADWIVEVHYYWNTNEWYGLHPLHYLLFYNN